MIYLLLFLTLVKVHEFENRSINELCHVPRVAGSTKLFIKKLFNINFFSFLNKQRHYRQILDSINYYRYLAGLPKLTYKRKISDDLINKCVDDFNYNEFVLLENKAKECSSIIIKNLDEHNSFLSEILNSSKSEDIDYRNLLLAPNRGQLTYRERNSKIIISVDYKNDFGNNSIISFPPPGLCPVFSYVWSFSTNNILINPKIEILEGSLPISLRIVGKYDLINSILFVPNFPNGKPKNNIPYTVKIISNDIEYKYTTVFISCDSYLRDDDGNKLKIENYPKLSFMEGENESSTEEDFSGTIEEDSTDVESYSSVLTPTSAPTVEPTLERTLERTLEPTLEPTPERTLLPSPTETPAASASPNPTYSASQTPSLSISPSPSMSVSPTPTPSLSVSPSPSLSVSPSPSLSVSPSPSLSVSPSPSLSVSPSPSMSVSASPSLSVSPSPSLSVSPSPSLSVSPSPSVSQSPTASPSPSEDPRVWEGDEIANAVEGVLSSGGLAGIFSVLALMIAAVAAIFAFACRASRRNRVSEWTMDDSSSSSGSVGIYRQDLLDGIHY